LSLQLFLSVQPNFGQCSCINFGNLYQWYNNRVYRLTIYSIKLYDSTYKSTKLTSSVIFTVVARTWVILSVRLDWLVRV